MTSLVHRCACRSMTSIAAGETVSLKGCAPGTPDPGGEGENLRMGWSSSVPPPASLKVVAPTATVSRRGLLRAYSVGSAAAASAAALSLASLTLASCLASFSAAFSAAFCVLSANLASRSDRLRSCSSSHTRRSSVFLCLNCASTQTSSSSCERSSKVPSANSTEYGRGLSASSLSTSATLPSIHFSSSVLSSVGVL